MAFRLALCQVGSFLPVSVKILRPSNGQVVGGALHFRSLVSFGTEDGFIENDRRFVNLSVTLSINGGIVHRGKLSAPNFECTLFTSVLEVGWNLLEVRILNEYKELVSDGVEVLVNGVGGDLVEKVLESTSRGEGNAVVPETFASRSSSVLFVGVGADLIAQLARLDSQTAAVLDADPNACTVLGSANVVHCIDPTQPSDLALEPYVDTAFISVTGVTLLQDQQLSEGYNLREVESILRSVRETIRYSIWLIVPNSMHNLSILTLSEMQFHRVELRHSSTYLNEELSSLEELMTTTAEDTLLRNGQSIYLFAPPKPSHGAVVSGVLWNSQNSIAQSSILSRIIHSNWTLGSVHVHLQNACLLEDGMSVVVFSDPSTAGANESTDWDGLLDRMVADESNGFQFSKLSLREVPRAANTSTLFEKPEYGFSNIFTFFFVMAVLFLFATDGKGVHTGTAEYLLRHATWWEGVTALPMSVQNNHIVHRLEALLQLLDCEKLRALPDLQRLIFPTLFATKAGDWIASMIALILQYGAETCGTPITESDNRTERARPAVFLRNHIFNTSSDRSNDNVYILRRPPPDTTNRVDKKMFSEAEIPVEELSGAVCFRDLILLGRTNTHLKFFSSPRIATEFRDFVHKKLHIGLLHKKSRSSISHTTSLWASAVSKRYSSPKGIPRTTQQTKPTRETGGSEYDRRQSTEQKALYCQPVSTNCTLHVYPPVQLRTATGPGATAPHRRLKVTISIRTSSRLILNLPELQRTMVRTGLVDENWLFNHVIVLETLSFRRQVEIMSETDVFICVHGAAAINGVFMHPGSVVIELFNARFVEFVFAAPLREVQVRHLYTYVRDHARDTRDCAPGVPPACLTGSVYDASSLDCVAIRSCSMYVDTHEFHLTFMEAYYHILGAKWSAQPAVEHHLEDAIVTSQQATDAEVIAVDAVVVREKYIAQAMDKNFNAALSEALSLRHVPGFDSNDPVYLLEVGVMFYSTGQHTQAYEMCSQALQGVKDPVNSAKLLVQIHVCLGAAGSYLTDLSPDGEHVVDAFMTAWRISGDLETAPSSLFEVESASAEHVQAEEFISAAKRSDSRSLLSEGSPMMAVPRASLEFNLLRAFERFGLFERCLDWYLELLRLPGLHSGGAFVVAFSIVQWSAHRRERIDQLEAQLRARGALSGLSPEVTLWDEILRVQQVGLHSVGGATQCLHGFQRTTTPGESEHALIDVHNVWLSVYNTVVSADGIVETTDNHASQSHTNDVLGPDRSSNCELVLLTQYYMHHDLTKQADINQALQLNLNNKFIAQVYLFNEQEFDYSSYEHSDKIYQFITGKRLTFQDAFRFANHYLSNRTVVLGKRLVILVRILFCSYQ